ncbi:MAG: hypothetical protein Edafosvirus5_52 [Edafosvirus sp.]|uniref:Uncharacterized protein n=1 Tax=Edafosvirus sp. TaxID=2487765 RepID=A0A3G4ZUY4_9VIRU|nr:MAG: hypothetical protein Edafosvirus5_52 [Edafosvirus sp.]
MTEPSVNISDRLSHARKLVKLHTKIQAELHSLEEQMREFISKENLPVNKYQELKSGFDCVPVLQKMIDEQKPAEDERLRKVATELQNEIAPILEKLNHYNKISREGRTFDEKERLEIKVELEKVTPFLKKLNEFKKNTSDERFCKVIESLERTVALTKKQPLPV